jgi:hypothetical protein
MRINYLGTEYHFDEEDVSTDEWRELKRKYKMTPRAYGVGMGDADPDASTFCYWIMLRRAGNQQVTLGDHLKPDVLALNKAIAAAQEAEAAAEAEEIARTAAEGTPDPTKPAPSAPSSPASPPPPAPPSPASSPAAAEGGSQTIAS